MNDTAEKIIIPVLMEFTEKRIKDLLCCGMEGGINYWAIIHGYEGAGPVEFEHLDRPFQEGGAVILGIDCPETEEEAEVRYRLDREALIRGLTIMNQKYPRHMGDFVADNEDAATGDVFIQCALLGEIVYG